MFSRALGFLTSCSENDLWRKYFCADLTWQLEDHEWYMDVKVYDTSHLYNRIYSNYSMLFMSIIELNLLISPRQTGAVYLLFIL